MQEARCRYGRRAVGQTSLRFTKAFEDTVAWLATHTAKAVVSEFMRVNWRTVGGICNRVYKDLEKEAPSRYDGLVNIGIDETSYKKGHKYMTVVLNHDTNSVVWLQCRIWERSPDPFL